MTKKKDHFAYVLDAEKVQIIEYKLPDTTKERAQEKLEEAIDSDCVYIITEEPQFIKTGGIL